jgi:Zn-dependent metalloprotease
MSRQRSTARSTGLNNARLGGVWAIRLRAGLACCAASIVAAGAAVGISLLALSMLVLALGASGVGGLAMSGQPLHVAVSDGAVAFYVTQLVDVSFFHHTAGLRFAFVPGLALVAVAIAVSAMVMVRVMAGSVRRRMLVTLLMAIAYALLAGFGARYVPLRLTGPFVGRNTAVLPEGAEAFLLPLLWGLLFAPFGGLVGVSGSRWRAQGSRVLGTWATPTRSSLRALAGGLVLTCAVVLVGGGVLAARSGMAHFFFAGQSFGHDVAIVASALLILPTLVLTVLLACFGVSFQWHLEALALTQGSGSILGGTLPTIGHGALNQVPGLLALLSVLGAVTVLSAGWLTARRCREDMRLGLAGALRTGVLMTLTYWLFALLGRVDVQAGGYLGAHLQVDVASLLWRVPLWCVAGSLVGSAAHYAARGSASRRELARILLDTTRPSHALRGLSGWFDPARQGVSARAGIAVAAFSLPAVLIGIGSTGAGATAGPSQASISVAPIRQAAERQLRTHAEPGSRVAVAVNSSSRVVDSAAVHIPLSTLGISSQDSPTTAAAAVLAHYGNLFGVADHPGELGDPEVVRERIPRTDRTGMTHVFYTQMDDGVPVFGGAIGVHLAPDGNRVDLISGSFIPEVSVADDHASLSGAQAIARAKVAMPQGKALHRPQLEVYAGSPSEPVGANARLAWFVELSPGPLKPTREYAVDASTGSILNVFNRSFNGVNAEIYDAEEKETLLGTKEWKTGEEKSKITEVAEAAEYTTEAGKFFDQEFPGACAGPKCNGEAAVETVDYGKESQQAEWNTEHHAIVFGKGFQAGLDLTGHEYAGGILESTVKPIYEYEEGTLMEGWADAMGKGFESWSKRNLTTGAWNEEINWEFASKEPARGHELRNLKEPEKTSDAPSLEKIIKTCEDAGDIHRNSTIFSHAFYELAQKIGIKEATYIFYPIEAEYRAKTMEQARNDAITAAKLLEERTLNRLSEALEEAEHNKEEAKEKEVKKEKTTYEEKRVSANTEKAFNGVGLIEHLVWPVLQAICQEQSICSGKEVLSAEEPKNGTSSTLEMLTTLYRARGVLAQPSVAGHYYMPLYEANMGKISELISRDPTLAEITVNGLKQITPALDALIEGEGQKYRLSKSVMNEIEAALKRLEQDDRMYSGGGTLATLIERELNFLHLQSYSGMTYAAGFKRLNRVVKPLAEKAPPPSTKLEDPECETRYTNELHVFGFTVGTPGHTKPGEASPLVGAGVACGGSVEKAGEPDECSTASKESLNTKAVLDLAPGDKLRHTKELANGSWIGTITGRVLGCAGDESKVGLGVTGIRSLEKPAGQCPEAAIACYEGSATVEVSKGSATGHDYAWVTEESGKDVLTVGAPEVEARGEGEEFKVPTGFTMFQIELCADAGEPGTEKCGTSSTHWVHENGEESEPTCKNGKGLYSIEVTNAAKKTSPREESCVYWGEELHKQLVASENNITGISCVPTTTDCALTDKKGGEYYSTNVSATKASTWTSWTAASTRGEAIACPSTSLCTLADGEVKSGGSVYYATSLGGTWTKAFEPSSGALSLTCPTSSFCVSGLESGAIRYSTKPGSTEWTGITIGSGSLNGVFCLSASFCTAVNSSGDLYVADTEAKVKEASGWKSTDIDGTTALHGVSCTSRTSCVAVDGSGDVIDLAINGSGEATARKLDVDASNDLTAVACTETVTCVAVDSSGNVLVSSSAGQTWEDEHALGKDLTSVACASSRLCVTADTVGDVAAFTPLAFVSESDTQRIDPGASLNAISCVPEASDCVVGDSKGSSYYSTGVVALTPATWTAWKEPTSPTEAVACPSSSLCVLASGVAAEGGGGNVYYATSLGGAWTEAFSPVFGVDAVSCGSTSMCVTADAEGYVRYSTKPASEEWFPLEIGSGEMTAVDCISASFCAVVDNKGNVHIANSEAKIKEESGWKSTDVDGTKALHGIACTSTTSCVAVDSEGHLLHLTVNGSGEATVSSEDLDGTNELTAVTCKGTLCVAVDSKGNVFESTNSGSTWKKDFVLGTDLTSVSCSKSTLCTTADSTGEVTTFSPE